MSKAAQIDPMPEIPRGQTLFELLSKPEEVVNDNLRTDVEKGLYKVVRRMDEVERITPQKLPKLADAFRNAYWDEQPSDPYYLSPTYYAVTGRRSLWRYNGQNAGFFFCLHPNQENTLLIFPPDGKRTRETLRSFINKIKDTGMLVQLARVNESNSKFATTFGTEANPFHLVKVPENTLDWAYPVRTASITGMLEREGPAYRKLRQAVNRYEGDGEHADKVEVRSVDFKKSFDVNKMGALAHLWEMVTEHYDDYSIPSDYFNYMITLASEGMLDLNGAIANVNGKDVAFSIWERPIYDGGTANLFASQLCVTNGDTSPATQHVLKYLITESGKIAAEQDGAQSMCLGGSETEGMDRFKRLFGVIPEKSPELDTYQVVYGSNAPEAP